MHESREGAGSSAQEVIRTVRRIELSTRKVVKDQLAGRYHSVFKGRGMAFSEVRPYSPGDDVRHIDWNVSARHQDTGLFVKQFAEERELTVMLLVDLSGSTDFGTLGKKKRRLLAEISSLIAFSAIDNNDRVGLVLFTDGVELAIPPRKGRKHVLRVIREVVELSPKGRATSIESALRHLVRTQKRSAVCFLISDWLGTGWERALRVTMARHDLVAIRVSDPAERTLPDLGLIEIEDAETGQRVWLDSSSASVRAAFAARQELSLRATQSRFQKLGCDLIDLSTDADFVGPLVEFLRARSQRQSRSR